MRSISVIFSSARRCTLELYQGRSVRGFANEFTERRLLHTAVSANSRLDHQIKPQPDTSSLNSVNQTVCWDHEIPKMKAVWEEIVHDLTETGPLQVVLPEAMKWLAEALNYNVPGGNTRRYFAVMYAYRNLVPADQINEENLRLARILGWCCEMWTGGYFVLDDVLDKAETRRGKLCWYKKNDIGINAAIDYSIITFLPLEMLRRHFISHPCYVELVGIFQQTILKAAISMTAETLAENFGKKLYLNNFTMDRYQRTLLFKSAFSIVLPAGIKDPEMLRQSEVILKEMGNFFQVQNDYRDCFGHSELKSQTDIAGGKFSWPITVALQRVTREQRKILDECYGQNDPEKIAKVKQLYCDLGIPKIYAAYEEQSYNLVNTYIQQISCELPHNIFYWMRDNIYGTSAERSKVIK